ncbi:MAG TPA: ABC transporter permease, partial [Pirellulales bacterium]|nr:ABC transporter permease [Pirellulales bacterium]
MSSWRFVFSSLVYHWRMNAAVALGVAVATAVLAGALFVGDSVRGSLRHLMLDRLGRIDDVLVSDRMFSEALATELNASTNFTEGYDVAIPAILLEGSLNQPDSGARANRVSLIGCDERFWKLESPAHDANPHLQSPLKRGEVMLNRPLADELAVKVGDDVVIRLPLPTDIPPDSPLGKKAELIGSRRLRVADVIAAEGLGRFGLRPNQQVPRNCYLRLDDLQAALDEPGRINAVLATGRNPAEPPPEETESHLADLLHPRLADYGLALHETKRGYFNLTSERMVIEPAAERAALVAFKADHPQVALTYLANYILAGPDDSGKIPYSTVTAIDLTDTPPLGPFTTPDGEKITALEDDEILLNDWAAEDLKKQGVEIKPGDSVRLTYFEPESTHGATVETTRPFKLKAIVALRGPAADPDFTPELRGVTDKESLANWDPPFPYDSRRVRTQPPHDEDERYWDERKATPKAFVSLKTGRRLWASRFGDCTSIRIPPSDELSQSVLTDRLEAELAESKQSLGFVFRPVKRQGLLAAQGTTDFNQLFLGFSFFIIASAVMLVALLFRLGMERRAGEVGTLLATGFSPRQVRLLLLAEGVLVATAGGALGLAGGAGYAWLMLAGLRSPGWWLAAVSTPFLHLHVTPRSFVIGYASGVIVSSSAIVWTLWRMSRVSVRRLLANQAGEAAGLAIKRPRTSRIVGWTSLAVAVAVGVAAGRLSGEGQAGAFFGSGALVLTALLSLGWARLRSGEMGALVVPGSSGVTRLAVRNGARNPGRSTLTIGLVAAAIFLIVAVSAFRLDPPKAVTRRTSGSGGFALFAESDQPLYHNLGTAEGRADLGFSTADEKLLAGHDVISLRVKPGDDASCLNLYQPQQPRVLGVPPSLIERGGFAWAGSAAGTAEEAANPWLLLNKPLAADRVPVVLDAATAMYSLHLGGDLGNPLGATYELPDGRGGRVTLEVVGLLKNSIFQGDLLVSEQALLKSFPDVSGYRYFLIDAPADGTAQVESALERTLGDFGFDTRSTHERLVDLMAVQNTYLSTFQSLGGLGLLLGTFGLAVVQLRNVLERRGELALLRAAGFRQALLARMVLLENGMLLLGGLVTGLLAALVAISPHLVSGGASLPWQSLAVTLNTVLVVGLLAGLVAVRAALATPLLPALRG